MILDCSLTIDSDGEARRLGIVTPKGTAVVKRTAKHLVLKVPGHQYWSSLYAPWAYAPAVYQVYEILHEEKDGTLRLAGLFEFPVRQVK